MWVDFVDHPLTPVLSREGEREQFESSLSLSALSWDGPFESLRVGLSWDTTVGAYAIRPHADRANWLSCDTPMLILPGKEKYGCGRAAARPYGDHASRPDRGVIVT